MDRESSVNRDGTNGCADKPQGWSIVNWIQDPSELPKDFPVKQYPERPAGYYVQNDSDWPARVCGSLSLQDMIDVAGGIGSKREGTES